MLAWSSFMNHPNTLSLRGSRQEHGGQNPPDALLSGWQRYSNNPSQVQQEPEFRFTDGLCRRSSGGWKARQQCL
jgi:hypothetical protein